MGELKIPKKYFETNRPLRALKLKSHIVWRVSNHTGEKDLDHVTYLLKSSKGSYINDVRFHGERGGQKWLKKIGHQLCMIPKACTANYSNLLDYFSNEMGK